MIKRLRKKGRTRYTTKINTHVPPEWCVHNTIAYEDILDLAKPTMIKAVWRSL